MAEESEYLTAEQARALLAVSHATMTRLLREKVLAWEPSPVDRRTKLVKRRDVQALLRKMPGKETDAA
jgi:hypothetical protein